MTNKIGGNNNKRMNGKDCLDSRVYIDCLWEVLVSAGGGQSVGIPLWSYKTISWVFPWSTWGHTTFFEVNETKGVTAEILSSTERNSRFTYVCILSGMLYDFLGNFQEVGCLLCSLVRQNMQIMLTLVFFQENDNVSISKNCQVLATFPIIWNLRKLNIRIIHKCIR